MQISSSIETKMKTIWFMVIRQSVKSIGRVESRYLFQRLMNVLPVEEKEPLQEAFIEIFSHNRH